ncbi:MAG: phospholipase D-like domain-containing protein [Archangium sp.]
MPIGPKKVGAPDVPVARPTTTPNKTTEVTPASKTWGATSTSPTSKATGFENTPSTARGAALEGTAPAAKINATTAVAFDAIKAPGGSAKARILDDNLDAWNARLDVISNAKTSIDATYFIMEKDPYGFAFLGGLLKKQMEGVKVRLSVDAMADTFGTRGFKAPLKGRDYLEELVNHGGEAYVYHPVLARPLKALKGDYSALASNHDKILVADNKVGITGGRNIAHDYFASPKDLKGAWRDMDVMLDGEGTAKGLTEAFEAELKNGDASQKVTKDVLGNWSKKDIQLVGAFELMEAWTKAPALDAATKDKLRTDPTLQAQMADQFVKLALAEVSKTVKREPSSSDVEFLTEQALALVKHAETRGSRAQYVANQGNQHDTQAKIIDQTSAASGQRVNNIAPSLLAMVEGAKKRIVVQNPYVVLTKDMMSALQRASERGVKIDIITNSPLSTDSDVTQAFFLEDWQMILQRCPTASIYVATGDRKFHTKSAVIDDDEAVISTYNLDLLSGFVNSEVGAVVKSRELASDLMQAFENDKADPANGFIQYTIERDATGKAVLKDGKPVPTFGPENHLSQEMLETYAKKRNLWGNLIRNNIPQFEPLRHDE